MNKYALSVLAVLLICVAAMISYLANPEIGAIQNKAKSTMGIVSSMDTPAANSGWFFKTRRDKLMQQMGSGIAIISMNERTWQNFYYLSGLDDVQAICVLMPGSVKPFTLFVLPRDPASTLWTGERYGLEGAVKQFGADAAYSLDSFNTMLPALLKGQQVCYLLSADQEMQTLVANYIKSSRMKPEVKDVSAIIAELRVIKDSLEIAQLRNAIEVTDLACKRVMRTIAPGQMEYDAQAVLEYVFMKHGMKPGFPSIVGSGANAAVLHYEKNGCQMKDGELFLMDIGAASGGYCADVTRTVPVNGKFSKEQKELYELVLKANEEGIKDMVPGKKILDCHHRATRVITDGLYRLGLIVDSTSWWQKRFYIQYRNDHYIGLDVHDVGSYGNFDEFLRDNYIVNDSIRGRELIPGMVLTMEPGLYLTADRLQNIHSIFAGKVPPDQLDAFVEKIANLYEKYSGIGIRIEDDILITETGNEVLSASAPKTVEDIETLMKR